MRTILLLIVFCLVAATAVAQVTVVQDAQGATLHVDGRKIMVNGMNWDYFPIGTTYTYSLWDQPDTFIRAALDQEMSMLKAMGVNAVRQYTGIPAKWIQYIFEEYGIYTMLNHSFGRYGLTIDGAWVAHTDYADPRVRDVLLREVRELAEAYQDTPGLLLYLLGNENNYGLFWEGAETEDIPEGQELATGRARPMYQLFNDGALAIKEIDTNHPVAICNGDLQFLDIIAEECAAVDIFGTNIYRGKSFGDAFQRVKDALDKPLLFTEFGADAYNAQTRREDQRAQAGYVLANWQEVYAHAAGMGKTGISLGGFTFQFSDGWWKVDQRNNLDIHDTSASWANGGYKEDYEKGQNNMNEEWFGVCAKAPTDEQGFTPLHPRAAYYVLQKVHQFAPYSAKANQRTLQKHFAKIKLKRAVKKAKRK